MSTFNPDRLSVEYVDGVSATDPIIPRRYTLTHSDETGDLFLTIGTNYAWETINQKLRDEVLGEWRRYGNSLFFSVYIYVDQGEYQLTAATKRDEIFERELPLALKAIAYGDQSLFNKYPFLNHSPILINFISSYPQLQRQENWGTFHRLTTT